MLNLKTKLEDIAKEDNRIINFFNDERIDYCCHGYRTIEETAIEKNEDPQKLLDSIQHELEELSHSKVESGTSLDEFRELSVEDMIHSIVQEHHVKENELFKSIDPLLNKILKVHYETHKDELVPLHRLFGALKMELVEHFIKEEVETFKLIQENPNPTEEIIKEIHELEDEHEVAGKIIEEIIEETNNFTPPENACESYKETFRQLEMLIKDISFIFLKKIPFFFQNMKSKIPWKRQTVKSLPFLC